MSSAVLFRRILSLPPPLRRSLYTLPSEHIYDVVCIGGGPAGLSFVSALQSHPSTRDLKIALIDGQPLVNPTAAPDSSSFSNRCSSLTPSSVRFLRQIGAWEHLNEQRTQPYHGMDVWDGVSGSRIQFDPLDGQGPGFVDALAELVPGNRFRASRRHYETDGHTSTVATMCENANLISGLLKRLDNGQSLRVLDKTKVDSISLGPEEETAEEGLNLSQWPIVKTTQGHLAARLLVGADGASSPVRTFADINSPGWDYNQHGVVATLTLAHSFSPDDLRIAYQRFLPTGSVALLPLPDNKASLVWSTSPQLASKLKQLAPADFTAMVNAAFRLLPTDVNYLLQQQSHGQAKEVLWRESATSAMETGLPSSFPRVVDVQPGTVASFPLRMRHADTYTGHRVALIGDAAHTVHPLAGQGLNLGLADAEALAQRIAFGMEHGMDIGSCWCLDEYNSDRWAANNAMLGVVDKLQKLYSVESGPVVWGRSLGLDLVNRLGPLKGIIMGVAAGSK